MSRHSNQMYCSHDDGDEDADDHQRVPLVDHSIFVRLITAAVGPSFLAFLLSILYYPIVTTIIICHPNLPIWVNVHSWVLVHVDEDSVSHQPYSNSS